MVDARRITAAANLRISDSEDGTGKIDTEDRQTKRLVHISSAGKV
jgi:hypothetical protein